MMFPLLNAEECAFCRMISGNWEAEGDSAQRIIADLYAHKLSLDTQHTCENVCL